LDGLIGLKRLGSDVKIEGSLIGMSLAIIIICGRGYAIEHQLQETYGFDSNSTDFWLLGIVIGVILLIIDLLLVLIGLLTKKEKIEELEQIEQHSAPVRQKICPKCNTDITFLAVCPKCGYVVKTK